MEFRENSFTKIFTKVNRVNRVVLSTNTITMTNSQTYLAYGMIAIIKYLLLLCFSAGTVNDTCGFSVGLNNLVSHNLQLFDNPLTWSV